jgi:hypothetical protein
MRPTIWVPGISRDAVLDIATNYLDGHVVRVQKCFPRLPAACKWERDLAPERPLMGSFALAVAVGMQPDEILLCGHDLFKHPSGNSHAGTALEARDWQQDFNAAYTLNIHRNHRFSGDVKYIRAALAAYRGKVSCVGSALAGIFRDEFPAWTWLEG